MTKKKSPRNALAVAMNKSRKGGKMRSKKDKRIANKKKKIIDEQYG